jgi:hypothetical protein
MRIRRRAALALLAGALGAAGCDRNPNVDDEVVPNGAIPAAPDAEYGPDEAAPEVADDPGATGVPGVTPGVDTVGAAAADSAPAQPM